MASGSGTLQPPLAFPLATTNDISSPWGHRGVGDLLDSGDSSTKLEISVQAEAEKATPGSGNRCNCSAMRPFSPGQLPCTCLGLVKYWLLESGGAVGWTEPGWGQPKGLGRFCHTPPPHSTCLLGSDYIHSTDSFLSGHRQNAGTLLQLGYTFTNSLSQALSRGCDLSIWCQDSYSLQDPFNPGTFTAVDAAPSPMVSSSFSWCQASAAVHEQNQ